jgi:Tfp pilus assembly protein PilF
MGRRGVLTSAICIAAAAVAMSGCARAPRKAEPVCPVSAPGDPPDEMTRAYELLRCGRLEEAISAFSWVANADPADKRARMELAYARQAAGSFDAAADDFELVAREPGEFQEQAQSALKALKEDGAEAGSVQRESLLDAGYEALSRGRSAEAREKFRLALAGDPRRPDITKQLGYMSMAEGDLAGAAQSFEGAHQLSPQDCPAALELGYIYARLRNDVKAEKAFESAEWCPDKKTRDAAAAALKNLRSVDPSLYLDIYAAPLFTSRFQDKILYFEAMAGWKPVSDWPVSLYVAGRFLKDSRSQSGEIPQIYSDNAASIGPGVKLQPRKMNLNLIAEIDPTLNLTRSEEHPDRGETNKRVVLADYAYWERRRLFADAGASVGFYSRYRDNVIAYAQFRAGAAVWESDEERLSLYAPVYASKDGNRDFFNNFVEIGAGAELATITALDLKLRAEYLRGFYMGIEGRDRNPYSRAYNDVRVMLVYSMRFDKERPRPAPVPGTGGPPARPGFKW